MKPRVDGRLVIRRATRRDAPAILRLLRGLAAYERLTRQMVATTGQIRRYGFTRRRYFEALICRRGRADIGLAVYYFTFGTFVGRPSLYLEDLFVLPAERGRGAGMAMLAELARIARRRGCARMEWVVLDWNKPSIRFYQRLGAKLQKQWIRTDLAGPALRRLAARRSVEESSLR